VSYLQRVAAALAEIDAIGLRRTIREDHGGLVDFSSNDYLGLARHPHVLAALHSANRAGSGGSRLLAGAYPEQSALEAALAQLVQREDALLFSSGYLAALGVAGALARFAQAAYSDELNHACLIDALRLTPLPRTIYPHLALPPAGERSSRALILSETAFGMDGDLLDVAALAGSLHDDDIAILDEAHALGVFGPDGGGCAAGISDPRVVVIGTLSKAFAALGGFVAGPQAAIELLRNTARTFVFDTALPPAIAAAAHAAVRISSSAEGAERRGRLHALAERLRAGLANLGHPVHGSGPVVSLVIGAPQDAVELAQVLASRGLCVPAIRPPTVPAGTSRLRITVRADHTPQQIEALLAALPVRVAS
jgi:8-amino-7-oxononanoate synthase